MIKKALVLLPPGTERTDDAVSPLAQLGGLTLIQRTLYSLQWAGIEEGVVLSQGEWPGLAHHLRKDSKIKAFSWLSTKASREYFSEGNAGISTEEDCVVQFPSWIVDRKVLRDLCGRGGNP